MSSENKSPLFSMDIYSGTGTLLYAHRHTTSMELLEVLDGTIEVQIGTAFLEGVKGDFFYIPMGLVHSVTSDEGGKVRCLDFERSMIEENLESIDEEILFMFEVQSRNKIFRFTKEHPFYQILKVYMNETYEEYASKDVCYKLPIRANIYLMVTALLRHYCAIRNEQDRNIYHNVLRLAPAISYINESFVGKIYIEELSERVMVSADYFTKMFRDSIGKTPIDYINDLRINHALAMLCETNASIQEISEATGFCNPNYFHKIFKQYMNCSPLAYRKASK